MCGIAGIVGRATTEEELRTLAWAQAHRGPDATGYFRNAHLGLTHLRLSIVDLDPRSNQPMTKGSWTICFNGEIYNYKELKAQLLSRTAFDTTSDTEVVLEAWRAWGPASLLKLRGMYAFALHDATSGSTFLVRDPFGIKPLYHLTLRDGALAFASELKALEALAGPQLTVNQSAVSASLLFAWIPESQCIWNEIEKLQPGHYLCIAANGRIVDTAFWNPESLVSPSRQLISDESEAVAHLEHVLLDSVHHHLIADVPVNAFLSGGLDSSLVVAMGRKHLGALDCYTIKFRDSDKRHEAMPDDASYAAKVAQHLDVKLNTIEVSPDVTQMLPRIVAALDEPIGDSAAINTLLICEASRSNGVKVQLSGMGADELFGGYRKHYANLLAAKYRRLPRCIRANIIKPLVGAMSVTSNSGGRRWARWAKRFVEFADLPEHEAFLRSYSYYSFDDLDKLTCSSDRQSIAPIVAAHEHTFSSMANLSLLDRMCFTDMQWFMTGLNLTYTDRASMAAATEVRVPYIDKEVVTAAFRIESSLKLRGRTTKYILKRVAERWLPHEIIYRPKAPFTMPLRAWMRHELSELVDDFVLSERGLAGRERFDPVLLQRLVSDDRQGLADNAQRIWHLLTLEQWFRNHGL